MTPGLSIIIPVKSRWKYARECCRHLQAQEFTRWECIVVDYNCPDETARRVTEEFADDARFDPLKVPVAAGDWNICAAMNAGFVHSVCRQIMFADCDIRPAPHFLGDAISKINEPDRIGRASDSFATLLMSREAVLRVRGWNENASHGWGDPDNEFTGRLIAAGYRLFDLGPVFPIPHTDAERNEFHNGASIVATMDRNREAMRTKPFIGLPENAR